MSGLSLTLIENGRPARLTGAVARVEDLSLILADDPSGAVTDHAVMGRDHYEVDVRPGRYRVQLILPSGQIVSRTADVAEGDTVPLQFSIGGDPEPAAPAADDPAATTPGRARSKRPARRSQVAEELGASFDYAPPSEVAAEASAVSHPAVAVMAALATGLTALVRAGRRASAGDVRLIEQACGSPTALWDVATDSEVPEWRKQRLAAAPSKRLEGDMKIWSLRWEGGMNTANVATRQWAYAELADEVQLASIPLPWFDMEREAPVDVEVRRPADGEGGITIRVADPHLSGLLKVLRHGRLGVARAIIEGLEQGHLIDRAIAGKLRNPLGACAAAYVGLAIFAPGEQERWDPWLPNLRHWFRWLPDGAILHARRIMLRPRGPEEIDEILPALKEAYRAGIPFYSVGLQLMREMLTIHGRDDEEARAMLERVTRLASRLEPEEAFTVLRYSKER
ncbi:MAG TPA: hypothetical protein VN231_15270 [Allosphingosinicella sp.]|nr:hypothetical protein [Allosphingosinicella sp.]